MSNSTCVIDNDTDQKVTVAGCNYNDVVRLAAKQKHEPQADEKAKCEAAPHAAGLLQMSKRDAKRLPFREEKPKCEAAPDASQASQHWSQYSVQVNSRGSHKAHQSKQCRRKVRDLIIQGKAKFGGTSYYEDRKAFTNNRKINQKADDRKARFEASKDKEDPRIAKWIAKGRPSKPKARAPPKAPEDKPSPAPLLVEDEPPAPPVAEEEPPVEDDEVSTETAETSQLLPAAKSGDADMVRRLVDAGASLSAVEPKWGYGALHFAAGHGHQEICKILIDAGIDVNVGSRDNETPLHMAAQEGKESVARYLVGAGANLNATNDDGETPLHVAVQSVGSNSVDHVVATLLALLQLGADPSIRDSCGYTPLSFVRRHINPTRGDEIVEVFRRLDPNYEDADINVESDYDAESLYGSSQASTDINDEDEYDTESLSGSSSCDTHSSADFSAAR